MNLGSVWGIQRGMPKAKWISRSELRREFHGEGGLTGNVSLVSLRFLIGKVGDVIHFPERM